MIARKEFAILAIATLITVLSWAVLDIFHHRSNTEAPLNLQKAAEPISPDFDLEGLP